MRRCASYLTIGCGLLLRTTLPSFAGPPYLSDDPEPADYKHFEIYTFSNGVATREGVNGEGGVDFNYGGAPNLQLTATLPVAYDFASSGPAWAVSGTSNLRRNIAS